MKLIQRIHGVVRLGLLLVQHHLFHSVPDCQRAWGDGEVFLRCPRCGLRSHGIQPGPLRLRTRLPGDPARLRPDIAA